jgi:hypothetical protein
MLIASCGDKSNEEEQYISQYFNSEIEFITQDIYLLEVEFQQLNSIDKYYDSSRYLNLNTLESQLKAIQTEVNRQDYSIKKIDSLTAKPLLKLKQGVFSRVFPMKNIRNWSDSLNQKMRNLTFLRYKKLILEKLIAEDLGPATLNDLQVLHFSSNNKEYLTFGLLDSISNNINHIEIKAAFADSPNTEIKTKINEKGLYSEIEFLTDKKGIIHWEGFYQVYAVSGETYSIPISGKLEKK